MILAARSISWSLLRHGVLPLLSIGAAVGGGPVATPPKRPHIMFVVSDDLRPTLGAYGTQALTPHVDALAARGLTFTRAFTQFPWCSPTRQSFMTGRRPDTTKAWTFTTSFRDALPDAVALPQHFRRQGWYAASVGKLYHGRNCVRGDAGCCPANATLLECVQQPTDADWAGGSWDEHPVDFKRVTCTNQTNATWGHWKFESHSWCESPAPESEYCDYKVAQAAARRLRAHAARARQGDARPLFLGVGFRDDHLPWASPARWRALFDPAAVEATAHGAPPDFATVPRQAWQFPAWVGPEYNLTDTKWLQPPALREALRSYMANIAFTDHQLGAVLAALAEVGYAERTLVLFTGDHGQNVGEHNTWTKMTAWEHSLRVPLIIAAPWLAASHGKVHGGMAEMCDFYRTLSDLAGLDPASVDKGVEGDSLAAAFADPATAGKRYAFSQTQRISVPSLRRDP
jgi:arylsulfatase A-like enzyme